MDKPPKEEHGPKPQRWVPIPAAGPPESGKGIGVSPSGTHANRHGGMFFPKMQPFSGMLKKNHIRMVGVAFSYHDTQTFINHKVHAAGVDFQAGMQHLENAKVNTKAIVPLGVRAVRWSDMEVAASRSTWDLDRSLESADHIAVVLPKPLGERPSPSCGNFGKLDDRTGKGARTRTTRSVSRAIQGSISCAVCRRLGSEVVASRSSSTRIPRHPLPGRSEQGGCHLAG
jgi:hypothetical protein